jgi:putative DNA primase/helicase
MPGECVKMADEHKSNKIDDYIISPAMSDEELMDHLNTAKNAAKFKRLFNGDISGYDHEKKADSALSSIIAFYTQDIDQIYRILKQSKLYGARWDDDVYAGGKISNAIRSLKSHYTKKEKSQPDEDEEDLQLLSLNSTTKRNAAYHVLANEYLKTHTVKYVYGKLREYKGGIYPIDDEAESFAKKSLHQIATENYKLHLSDSNAGGVIRIIESKTLISKNECEPNKDSVIVLNNGILNMNTWELEPFSPDKVYFSKSPIDYNSNAPEPVMFTKLINDVFKGNEKQKALMQELFGYCLTNSYKYQKIFYMLGDGGNGKGTVLKILTYLIGTEYVSAFSLYQLTDGTPLEYNIAQLQGKKANICGDIGSKKINNTDSIKKLSSGTDEVTGRNPTEKPFKFINAAKIIIAANKMPWRDECTTGEKRRDCIVYFENHLSEKSTEIKDFAEKIINSGEMSGVLNWAIEGLKRLEEQQDFTDSRTVEERGNEYDKVSNPLKYFVDDCIREDAQAKTPTFMIYDAYNKYRKQYHMPELSDHAIKTGIKRQCGEVGVYVSEKRIHADKLLGFDVPTELKEKIGTYPHVLCGIKLKQNDNDEPHEENDVTAHSLIDKTMSFMCANPGYMNFMAKPEDVASAFINENPEYGKTYGIYDIIDAVVTCRRGCRA